MKDIKDYIINEGFFGNIKSKILAALTKFVMKLSLQKQSKDNIIRCLSLITSDDFHGRENTRKYFKECIQNVFEEFGLKELNQEKIDKMDDIILNTKLKMRFIGTEAGEELIKIAWYGFVNAKMQEANNENKSFNLSSLTDIDYEVYIGKDINQGKGDIHDNYVKTIIKAYAYAIVGSIFDDSGKIDISRVLK